MLELTQDSLVHDIHLAQNGGSTPLTLAVEGGHCDCVDVLIEEGASVDLARHVSVVSYTMGDGIRGHT